MFADQGECLRLEETVAWGFGGVAPNDEMVVVAPNGAVYRNDNFGGTTRPRVAFVAPKKGWYLVSIAHSAGNALPEHDFIFAYGRYAFGASNPNCSSPTPPYQAIEPQTGSVAPREPYLAPPPGAPTAR